MRCNIESTERERRRQQQHTYAADKEKLQKLYNKYLRAESFRKALVYQKRYLLLLLGKEAYLKICIKYGNIQTHLIFGTRFHLLHRHCYFCLFQVGSKIANRLLYP